VMNFSLERTYLETSFEFSPLSLPAPPSGDSSTSANAAVTSPEEAENLANASRSGQPAPPTLPKPRSAPAAGTPTPPVNQNAILSGANDSSVSGSLDKKIRNCTQV
jgi:hypothetical protein